MISQSDKKEKRNKKKKEKCKDENNRMCTKKDLDRIQCNTWLVILVPKKKKSP